MDMLYIALILVLLALSVGLVNLCSRMQQPGGKK